MRLAAARPTNRQRDDDDAHGTVLGAGGYAVMPAKAVHWGLARTDVVAVRFADGPADTHPAK